MLLDYEGFFLQTKLMFCVSQQIYSKRRYSMAAAYIKFHKYVYTLSSIPDMLSLWKPFIWKWKSISLENVMGFLEEPRNIFAASLANILLGDIFFNAHNRTLLQQNLFRQKTSVKQEMFIKMINRSLCLIKQ